MSDFKRIMDEIRADEQKRLESLEEQRAADAATAGFPPPKPRRVEVRNRKGLR